VNRERSGIEKHLVVESTRSTQYFKHVVEAEEYPMVVFNTLKLKVINGAMEKTDKQQSGDDCRVPGKEYIV
jgi:hypothetical protein